MKARILVAAALLTLAAGPASAQIQMPYASVKGMDERFRLDVGGFFQKFDTSFRLDSSDGEIGTDINLEDDLGADSNQTNIRLDGYWRFGRHGRLDFGYRGWNRKSSHTLSREIDFGDDVYQVGAQVDTQIRVNVGELYYAYSFVNNGELELGLGIGFSVYWNKLALDATGTVTGGGGGGSGSQSFESRDVVAPIPALEGHLTFTLLPGFFATAKAKGIKVTVDPYSGHMVDVKAGLDYFFSKNIGIGVSYEYVEIVYKKAEGRTVQFTYTYSGPLAYLALAF